MQRTRLSLLLIVLLWGAACGNDEGHGGGNSDGEGQTQREPALNWQVEAVETVSRQDGIARFNPGSEADRVMAIAPDGSALAWYDDDPPENETDALCFYFFADTITRCYPEPDAVFGNPLQLHWSPDSAQVAFTPAPFGRGFDTDIWTLTLRGAAYQNLTEDRVELLSPELDNSAVPRDYLPTWHPNSGEIFFFRSFYPLDADPTLALYRVPSAGGEAQRLRDLSQELPVLSVRPAGRPFLDGAAAISPDGSQLAFIVTGTEFEDERIGIWVIKLDGASPPRQLTTRDSFTVGVPAWHDFPLFPLGLAWDADGTHLAVVAADDNEEAGLGALPFLVEVESGDVRALIDLSQVTDAASYLAPGEEGLAPAFFSVRAATMTPDRTALLMLHSGEGRRQLSLMALDSNRGRPQLVEMGLEDLALVAMEQASMADSGLAVLLGNLVQVSE
jgi:Tol biopolymer transport system component